MNHSLKGTNLDLTAEIRSYVESKLNKLDEMLGESARADVELEYKVSEEKTYRAEVMLYDGATLRATARGGSLHEAFDKVCDEIFAELSRRNKKRHHLLRRGGLRLKEYLRGWRRQP